MKWGIGYVLTFVQVCLEGKISRESFDKTLQFLIETDSVKSISVSKKVWFSIWKIYTCRDTFNIEEEFQSFQNELVEEINRLTLGVFHGNKLV